MRIVRHRGIAELGRVSSFDEIAAQTAITILLVWGHRSLGKIYYFFLVLSLMMRCVDIRDIASYCTGKLGSYRNFPTNADDAIMVYGFCAANFLAVPVRMPITK